MAANKKNLKTAEPRERFKTEEERVRHREGMARRHHAQLFNANFNTQSLYSTLTLDNEHEVHTFEEARVIRDRFARRLKYANPAAQFILYMGRGKGTNRIHFHMTSNGLSEDAIRGKWQAGSIVRVEPLRAHNYYDGTDYGQDYTGLANYLFDHWTPEQGGHHYKTTKNRQLDILQAEQDKICHTPADLEVSTKNTRSEKLAFSEQIRKTAETIMTIKRRNKA